MELRIRKDAVSSGHLMPEATMNESTVISPSISDENYMNRLTVYSENLDIVVDDQPPEEPHMSSDTRTTNTGFKMLAKNNAECHEGNEKIKIALKLLNLRDMCYLIQFWPLYSIGKYKFLKTVNQPFGLGIYEEGLCSYRKESEHKWLPVDAKVQEHDLIPAVRVFKRGLPEWTSDITKGYSGNHPLQDCAFRSNLHGYLVLPVFDSLTMSCVGVLESITSSKYFDCAYEVQQIHRALKAANLTSPQAFDSSPMSYVDCNTHRELDEIFKTLKDVCEAYKLPLAQTWTISSKSSFVATGGNIEMTCSSFNSNCIGEVCMSTTTLPFYVHDLRFWPFREACKEHHLLKSRGVVGRALSSHGTCFCADVTKLDDDEYSLVHNARMNGLASCFAIYVHSIDHGSYVLEFFLPVDMKEVADLQNLVQKVKLHLNLSSFVLGDVSTTDLIGMQTNVSQLSLQMQPNSKVSATVGKTNAEIHCINALDQGTFNNNDLKNWNNGITNSEKSYVIGVTRNRLDVVTKQRRKHKKDSVTREAIQQNFGKPIGEASKRLGGKPFIFQYNIYVKSSRTTHSPKSKHFKKEYLLFFKYCLLEYLKFVKRVDTPFGVPTSSVPQPSRWKVSCLFM